ncbi:MAG: recombinase family protein, partial [Allobaculum sp.]|nr:recombinase family protein [Allobaculum sp.]
MTVYGYCRVSTPKQNIERQIKNIIKACPEILERNIYLDRWTGTTTDRPQWKKLERRLKEGDTIIFDSVSRMSRQAKEGFALYKRLYDMGVNLIFLKEPYINTDQYKQAMQISLPEVEDSCLKPLMNGLTETLMLLAQRQFIAAFEQAEKEVEDLRQRTREGFTPEARRKISESKQG